MTAGSERLESNVQLYGKLFPDSFVEASGSLLKTSLGREYIDFFSGAGALNYGHNNEFIRERLIQYLGSGGVIHALDMQTPARSEFLDRFHSLVLEPRNLRYRVQFCGPTGTNAIEAALKLARKVNHRPEIVAFTGSYHGLSLGSLAVTSMRDKRSSAGAHLGDVTFFPYPAGFLNELDTRAYIEAVLADPCSGVSIPAAIVLETVQAEGGVHIAPVEWLRWLRKLCDRYGIIFICDEVQVGCFRTGHFFSFERAGIVPDLVTLSKSISGYGAPMSVLLMRPDLDQWDPGEHTGTFRGYQLAYVGATAALEYMREYDLKQQVMSSAALIENYLRSWITPLHPSLCWRGLGMIWGIDLSALGGGERIAAKCYERGLLIECAGRNNSVLKLLPPLTTSRELLSRGLDIIREAIASSLCTEHIQEAVTQRN